MIRTMKSIEPWVDLMLALFCEVSGFADWLWEHETAPHGPRPPCGCCLSLQILMSLKHIGLPDNL